jgi:hypothetical protein
MSDSCLPHVYWSTHRQFFTKNPPMSIEMNWCTQREFSIVFA